MNSQNLFCQFNDLKNEADVEQIFLRRMIEYLGYADSEIRPKDSLTQLTVGGIRGAQAQYRPDFAIVLGTQVRWILEAKAPSENLDNHVWQPRGYCTVLNGQHPDDNPVRFFVLSNGVETRLYQWDINDPLLKLTFEDITATNDLFQRLSRYLARNQFKTRTSIQTNSNSHKLEKRPLEDVNAAFAWCHQFIYKKDNISQAAAFTEFTKVIFLKLLSDRRVRDKYPQVFVEEVAEVPREDVRFSLHWLSEQEKHTPNPLNTIQFRDFITSMEREIQSGRRKRIFDSDEEIRLSPETIRGVVGKLENIFLFGIDVDLNGRLFETFLNATMRGKDLGQYFTPRSIVKLGVQLAQLRVNVPLEDGSRHTDLVLDACCGSGGFLIDALALMWAKVDKNSALSEQQKKELKELIANRRIYGIDVGKEPPLARIARLNMYLHGDGGASIFQVDALDKDLSVSETDALELSLEKQQCSKLFKADGFADVVLTNPPFAKTYDRNTETEKRILDRYKIAYKKGSKKPRPSLKSSLMFIERYHDLLKPGGRMVTVIDDGILSGKEYKWFREYIRENFIIRAVISLPGDAFQRSKARVKTSLLIVEKRDPKLAQEQPAVFMYGCEYVGIDDPSRQRILPVDYENRRNAIKEIETVVTEYTAFLAGNGNPNYVVPPSRITDRLDVKSCLMQPGRMVKVWKQSGLEVVKLGDLLEYKELSEDDIIDTKDFEDFVTYLRVTYSGFAQEGDEILASETKYNELYRVHTDDIVISNIAAVYGSVAVVPPELDGCVVTTEYTILRAKPRLDNRVLWMLLRSPQVRSEMLLSATGISRNRVSWEELKEIQVPIPNADNAQQVLELISEAEASERVSVNNRKAAKMLIEQPLSLDNQEAFQILRAFKPPK